MSTVTYAAVPSGLATLHLLPVLRERSHGRASGNRLNTCHAPVAHRTILSIMWSDPQAAKTDSIKYELYLAFIIQ